MLLRNLVKWSNHQVTADHPGRMTADCRGKTAHDLEMVHTKLGVIGAAGAQGVRPAKVVMGMVVIGAEAGRAIEEVAAGINQVIVTNANNTMGRTAISHKNRMLRAKPNHQKMTKKAAMGKKHRKANQRQPQKAQKARLRVKRLPK